VVRSWPPQRPSDTTSRRCTKPRSLLLYRLETAQRELVDLERQQRELAAKPDAGVGFVHPAEDANAAANRRRLEITTGALKGCVASQAPDPGKRENGIAPFDCPRDKSVRAQLGLGE
jgi:hypothetical protein